MESTMWVLIFVAVLFMNGDKILASDPDPITDFCIPDPDAPVKTACKNPLNVTINDFVFSGIKLPGNFTDAGMAAIPVIPAFFPGLNTLGMSFIRIDIKPGGINPPHSHPRASEFVYVVKGKLYSGFVDSTSKLFAREIEQGDIMVFPKGLTHFMMNIGQDNALILACLNSQSPGYQKIASAIFGSGINENLLQKAFGIDVKSLANLKLKHEPKSVK